MSLQLGIGDITKTFLDDGYVGIIGLGSRFGEAIVLNPSPGQSGNSYPTIYDQLLLHGYIKRRLFSIWLNDQSASTGSILFGGIDPTKYRGQLRSLPVILSGPNKVFTGWRVNLTSIVYVNRDCNKTQALTADDFELSTVLDSGSPNMYLPSSIANSIAFRMNATMYQGFPYVSCKLRRSSEALEFAFGGKNQGGPVITVPYSEIIYPYGAPANLGNVTASDGSPLCYLGLIGTDAPISLLGDTFIRSAYLVYDVDSLQVMMAPARFNNSYEESSRRML